MRSTLTADPNIPNVTPPHHPERFAMSVLDWFRSIRYVDTPSGQTDAAYLAYRMSGTPASRKRAEGGTQRASKGGKHRARKDA